MIVPSPSTSAPPDRCSQGQNDSLILRRRCQQTAGHSLPGWIWRALVIITVEQETCEKDDALDDDGRHHARILDRL